VLALDAKMTFDDNALYRHKDIAAMRDLKRGRPARSRSVEVNLNYIGLDGTIACMVNGAVLLWPRWTSSSFTAARPPTFSTSVAARPPSRSPKPSKFFCSDKNVRGILVNIFGGIMKCDVIATGILTA